MTNFKLFTKLMRTFLEYTGVSILVFMLQLLYILSAYVLLLENPENNILRASLSTNINLLTIVIYAIWVVMGIDLILTVYFERKKNKTQYEIGAKL